MSLINSFPGGNGGPTIEVDDAMSSTSENPVQNKVIYAAMGNKADLVDGKVPANQLPSYVDDVVEGYLVNKGALVKDIIAKLNDVAGTNITYTGDQTEDTRNLIASISGNQIVIGRFVNYSGKISVVGSAAGPATSGAGEVYASSAQSGAMTNSMSTSGSTDLGYHYNMAGGSWNWMPGTIYYNGPDVDVSGFSGNAVEIGEYRMTFYLDAQHTQAVTPEKGKIYVDLSTNLSYRWSGTTFICISNPITVDDALSNSSTNPVQNKVVTNAIPSAYSSTPAMDGTGSAGSSSAYARGDHVHPKDTSKQDVITAGANLTFNGNRLDASYPVMGVVSKSDLYDTTEKVIGKWTDGRPVYQKTIDCGTIPNSNTKTVSHGISNIKEIVYSEGIAISSLDSSPLPYVDGSRTGENWNIELFPKKSEIYIKSYADWTNYHAYVTIQYTKTTDAANSYKYADENEYSTTEHIVGKWIDGKPVYQKTISWTMPSNFDTGSNGKILDLSNIDKLIGVPSLFTNWIAGGNSGYDDLTSSIQIFSQNGSGIYYFVVTTAGAVPAEVGGHTVYATIRYTKTTD